MGSWNELLTEFGQQAPERAGPWLVEQQTKALQEIGRLRGGRNVLYYASAFLQKPMAPAGLMGITPEDLNAFMSTIYGMTWTNGLTLVLHTPGGSPNAAETIVDYLRSKFESIEVIVPAYAMSAGTMIALAADRVIMGRQSQLGPIDPQMPIGGRFVSARSVVDQFERAKTEILADQRNAHVWATVMSSLGPSLLQEAQNALDYGELMVGRWLSKWMFGSLPDDQALAKGEAVAKHFNDASTHKSHGRRIGRDECRKCGVEIEDLDGDGGSQALQEAVLTSYHLGTIAFEQGPALKFLSASHNRSWVKNWQAQMTSQVP